MGFFVFCFCLLLVFEEGEGGGVKSGVFFFVVLFVFIYKLFVIRYRLSFSILSISLYSV